MAGFAIDFGDVVRMGIFLDVRVAVIALQTPVNAGAELVAVDRDAVTGCILHCLVAMAGKAVGLRCKAMRRNEDHDEEKAEYGCSVKSSKSEVSRQPSGWTGNNCDEEPGETCGFGHAAVFPLRGVSNRIPANGFPAAEFPLALKPLAGIATLRRRHL